jgi:ATP-dependent protease ClpP protease subunit
MPDHYLFLTAEITPVVANTMIQFLGGLIANPPDRLVVAMNSPGGNVVSGIAIYDAMCAMPYPIVTHNIGNVDSIANVIYLSGSERNACTASTFMFHGVGFNGNANERLDENNVKAKLDTILSDHKRISGIFATRTGGQVTVKAGMRLFKEQKTRSAQWAHSKGFVHHVRDLSVPAGAVVNFLS